MNVNENAPHAGEFDDAPQRRRSLSVNDVADFLSMRGAKPIVALLSPSGDDGSTASVMLARSISELGQSVVLVDMTASGCPTKLMSQEPDLSGISDLLFGDTAFGEAIHHDRLSSAHIVPKGVAQPRNAIRLIERLTMVLNALSDSYDTVLLEFGAADIAGVVTLLKYIDAEVILSLPGSDSAAKAEIQLELQAHGYADVMVIGGTQSGDLAAE